MFPEYVEKHVERQRAAELEAEKQQKNQDAPAVLENPIPVVASQANGNGNQPKKGPRQRQSFPLWLMAIIVAIFASLMALPLLTLL
jgi:hypothetical protein